MSIRRRRNRSRNKNLTMGNRSKDIVELWILKILLDLNGHRDFLDSMRGVTDDSIAYFLGLDKFIDEYEDKDKKEIFQIMRDRLEVLESSTSLKFPKILKQNIKKVTKLITLNKVEKDILIFTIYLKYFDMMDNATRMLNDLSTDRLVNSLGVLLNHKASKVKAALSPQGKLAQSGLVTVDRDGSNSFLNKLDILSRDFADKMMNLNGDIEEMIRDSVRKCAASELDVSDFNHLGNDMELLVPYLDSAISKQQSGVNILFYGKPGTGKTELTKAIAKELDKEIYEVSYADEDDEPISGDKRLKAYKVAQSFFSNSNVLILFDEIEDVVGDDNSMNFFAPPKQSNKGWMNRILENNKIPAIWITNDIYHPN